MKIETLKAQPRQPHGKRTVRRLRQTGLIPAIVYGHGKDPSALSVSLHDAEALLAHGAHVVNIEVDGRTESCLLKEVQFDHLGAHPIHVDLARIDLKEKVRVKVPLELRGHAKGQSAGGIVSQQLIDLEVECMVTDIPDSIRVNIANLELNQVLHVREITLPEGVRSMVDGEMIVATCRELHVPVEAPAATAEAAEVPTEPEVIAKGKVETEEGAATEEKK